MQVLGELGMKRVEDAPSTVQSALQQLEKSGVQTVEDREERIVARRGKRDQEEEEERGIKREKNNWLRMRFTR